MHFLKFNFNKGAQYKLPNVDLREYTKSLLDKEKERYDYTKKLLNIWLGVFDES